MSEVARMLARVRDDRTRRRGIQMFSPATSQEIEACFAGYSSFIPQELINFYSFTNGMQIGDFRILPLNETLWPELTMMSVQDWGTGDYDCVEISDTKRTDDPPISFSGCDPPWTFKVCDRFSLWLERVIAEFCDSGDIFSPWACDETETDLLLQMNRLFRSVAGERLDPHRE